MRAALISVFLLVSGVANGATSLQIDGTHAIGITGLTIGGTDYDVVFDDLYDGTLAHANGYYSWISTFGIASNLAYTTATDMAGLFDGAGVIGVKDLNGVDLTGPYNNHGVALFTGYDDGIPCFEGGTAEAAVAMTTKSNPGNWGSLLDSCVPYDSSLFAGAYFKVSAIPVPAAIWMFGSALAGMTGMGWMRRRQVRG